MKTAAEYRKHADECRQLASNAVMDAERQGLLEIAAMWERLAKAREQELARGRNSN